MKLSQATDQDKMRAIAGLDGWREVRNDGFAGGFMVYTPEGSNVGVGNVLRFCPDYLTSYDAILPVVQKQSRDVIEKFITALWELLEIDSDYTEYDAWYKLFGYVKPSKIADAILIATGKFKA